MSTPRLASRTIPTRPQTTTTDSLPAIRDPFRKAAAEATTRSTVTAGLGALIVIHAVDGVAKWSETPYIFWMYMAAIAASLAAGAALLLSQSSRNVRRALLASAAIAGSVLLGYIVNRTVGMPGATDDIGNWTEPLGLASIVAEGLTVAAALAGWRAMRDTH